MSPSKRIAYAVVLGLSVFFNVRLLWTARKAAAVADRAVNVAERCDEALGFAADAVDWSRGVCE